MLTPNIPIVKSAASNKKSFLPDEFSLLCWNIQKENLKKEFTPLIQNWKKAYSIEMVLLQEARFFKTLSSIADFPFVAAANLSLFGHFSGVLTAASVYPFSSQYKMTKAREAFITTRKSTLITLYTFKDQSLLMVINIHAINFRSLACYKLELSRLHGLINLHKGPVILAGDFNCWRKSRKEILDEFACSLNLEHTRPRFSRHVKKWFGHRLDRVYSKGLILLDVKALDCKSFSDHNPIIVTFAQPEKKEPKNMEVQ
ncbi:MAG: endonuclease/exonuclease/phosphatase family protein [Desulfobacula sp.]|jgi:endonuclease/exonuclease/phosphatase (EEP) superfamily protein YafD|uniref:endonuclease/exonuclease/phosphatase family protein n=1 Tax=Desulfobacula sp. TaxID=2593537 RepID=UPI001D587C45|nr:endonuclease/exonuclease/phosphatase family protein [Desulfobacula sp.]MBT3484450.1 endonuclease/exonuclease/phosphatase family protein [Desulfobacula sp.]MBT3803088.1 endonuclease/exonuclease/phosphatase family protein [Desulfobacula sp.]MBT4023400.1 endonuclease/exonuclease/phosphatase family protein [Desulfobacula sp.]MBT4197136.1 endonuclease/exonuclease/phosphatase family protein [Desulfobacula sp.]